jgi:hypothetical protein
MNKWQPLLLGASFHDRCLWWIFFTFEINWKAVLISNNANVMEFYRRGYFWQHYKILSNRCSCTVVSDRSTHKVQGYAKHLCFLKCMKIYFDTFPIELQQKLSKENLTYCLFETRNILVEFLKFDFLKSGLKLSV